MLIRRPNSSSSGQEATDVDRPDAATLSILVYPASLPDCSTQKKKRSGSKKAGAITASKPQKKPDHRPQLAVSDEVRRGVQVKNGGVRARDICGIVRSRATTNYLILLLVVGTKVRGTYEYEVQQHWSASYLEEYSVRKMNNVLHGIGVPICLPCFCVSMGCTDGWPLALCAGIIFRPQCAEYWIR